MDVVVVAIALDELESGVAERAAHELDILRHRPLREARDQPRGPLHGARPWLRFRSGAEIGGWMDILLGHVESDAAKRTAQQLEILRRRPLREAGDQPRWSLEAVRAGHRGIVEGRYGDAPA